MSDSETKLSIEKLLNEKLLSENCPLNAIGILNLANEILISIFRYVSSPKNFA
ncbi:11415_t:CDS:1, partial [Scutellospora calospora]